MTVLKVTITRYVSDDQPGFVECEFTDANGRQWRFVEKAPVVSSEQLTGKTAYPRPGVIAVEVKERRTDSAGREVILVDTSRHWGVESVEGETIFEVMAQALTGL
jgi:hypothetical protein